MASPEQEPPKTDNLVELDYRRNEGLEVFLFWKIDTDTVIVEVVDVKKEEHFRVYADKGKALDVFHHPYAYGKSGSLATEAAYRHEAAA
jgi:hypothetical protein